MSVQTTRLITLKSYMKIICKLIWCKLIIYLKIMLAKLKHLVWQKARSCKIKTQRKSYITHSAVLRRLCWVKDHYIIPLCVIYLIAPLSSVTVLLNKVERPLALFHGIVYLTNSKSYRPMTSVCRCFVTDQ